MASELAVLQAQRNGILEEANEIIGRAAERGDGLTAEEQAQSDELIGKANRLQATIDRLAVVRDEMRHAPAEIVREAEKPAASVQAKRNPWLPDNFASYSAKQQAELQEIAFGSFMQAVYNASKPGGSIDPRLTDGAAVSGMSTGVPGDGGFLVGTDFSTMLMDRTVEASRVANLCTPINITTNADGIKLPYINETSRATGSRFGGVQVYRRSEAATVTASQPEFAEIEIELADLMGIAYATDRLMADAAVAARVLGTAFVSDFAWKLDNEIIRGLGVGECLGILSADCTVSQAKETGQAATSLVFENLSNMWARLRPQNRGNAVWFYNQDVEPQLDQLSIAVGTAALEPRFVTYDATGAVRIKGRPTVAIEQASTLGTVGDVILADMSEYLLVRKGGITADESMHVRFLYNERTFRWNSRVNGRPAWNSAITPANGTATVSPFVTLATRA